MRCVVEHHDTTVGIALRGIVVKFSPADSRFNTYCATPRAVEKARMRSPSQWSMHQGWAMRHRLRLFTGDDDVDVLPMTPQVTVKLGDISRALVDANRRSRTWLDDFADDEVKVSADLYEVICTYLRLRPGA